MERAASVIESRILLMETLEKETSWSITLRRIPRPDWDLLAALDSPDAISNLAPS